MNANIVLANMNQHLLPPATRVPKPSVVILHGRSGCGKTRSLERLAARHPRSIQILAPAPSLAAAQCPGNPGDPLLFSAWTEDSDLALDELDYWDKQTLPGVVSEMEARAMATGRTLVLVVQWLGTIVELGLRFRSPPAVMTPDDVEKAAFDITTELAHSKYLVRLQAHDQLLAA